MATESEGQNSYDLLKEALSVSIETYCRKREQLRSKLTETWTVCGKIFKCLVKKMIAGSESVKDMVELLTNAGLMPRSVANHVKYVKDCSPTTLTKPRSYTMASSETAAGPTNSQKLK